MENLPHGPVLESIQALCSGHCLTWGLLVLHQQHRRQIASYGGALDDPVQRRRTFLRLLPQLLSVG